MKKLLLVLLCLPFIGFGQCTSGNCQQGYGVFTEAQGTYEGNFKNGKAHGYGVFKGILYTYDGQYVNGQQHGQGKKTYTNGKIEEGTFENGNFIKAKSGCISGNCVNGQGTYIFGKGKWEGDKYVGEFNDGWRSGQGTYTYANGDKYVGEWKDGNRNGQGTYTSANGTIQKGQWIDGVYQQSSTKTKPSQNRFTSLAMEPKNQIGYIMNPSSCPWGFNTNNFLNERFGWYVDYKFAYDLANSDHWPAWEKDFVEYDLNKTMTGNKEISSGRYTVLNAGLSTRIGGNSSSAWILNVGLGRATEMSYDVYSSEYPSATEYVRNGGISALNLNFGVLRQTNSVISWQVGFDSAVKGINFGIGFTWE